jgi:hypothetical protein
VVCQAPAQFADELFLIDYLIDSLTFRLVPVRSVYVPGLREAFGFNLIDIVLEHSLEHSMVQLKEVFHSEVDDTSPEGVVRGNRETSKYLSGMGTGRMQEGQKKRGEGEDDGRPDVRAIDVMSKSTDQHIAIHDISVTNKSSKDAESSSRSDRGPSKECSLRMTDSTGTSVKLQFDSQAQLRNVLQLLHSAGTASQRTTIPILFKSVTVKSLFGNSVTCLQATEISRFMILDCCDARADNVSVHLILCYLVLSYPVLSYPILSYPILSYPILSYPIQSCPVLSYTILSCPVLSCSILSCPVLSCPVLLTSHAVLHLYATFFSLLSSPFSSHLLISLIPCTVHLSA